MKKYLLSLIFLSSQIATANMVLTLDPPPEDIQLRQFNIHSYIGGRAGPFSTLTYIVDKKSNLCFLQSKHAELHGNGSGVGVGLASLPCKSLKGINQIKYYLEND